MTKAILWGTRMGGLLALVLGLSLGSGDYASLVRIHMALGWVVTVALVAMVALAFKAGVRGPMPVVALLWAAAVVPVGLNQMGWMSGSGHWVVEAIHTVLGVGAMGLAEMMGGAIRRKG